MSKILSTIGQCQIKQYVKQVLHSFSKQTNPNINQSLLNAMDCLPFDYGTGNYNKICNAVIAELKKRAAK